MIEYKYSRCPLTRRISQLTYSLDTLTAIGFVSADMAAAAVMSNQNVVERVTSLPLVSSTYGLVSSMYSNTKDKHPYIRTVCEAAEQGVRSITSVALTTASPIIGKLEPQIAIANDLACKGLDRIENTLPILNQPPEQIVSSAKGVVTNAKDAVTGRVSGAKDTVSDTLSSAVENTRGAVQDRMDRTKAVVSWSVSTVLESRVARLVSSGVDTALSTSESLVEQYLPLTEDELELEAKTVKGFDKNEPSYYVRLGSLSTKLRKRAYTKAMIKIQDGKQRSMELISEVNSTVDLIEYGRKNIDGANQMVNNRLNSLLAWKSSGSNQENDHEAEVIESRTLTLAHSLTQQLQTTCLVLASSLHGLPNHIQQEVLSLSRSATQIYSSFSKAMALGDLPDSVLSSSKVQLGKIKNSLDNVMDYLVNNTPLNWLVGPFYPRIEPTEAPASAACSTQATSSSSPSTQSHQEEPMEVEMKSLHSQQYK
ncbi:perilipin-2 isoform X2 [Sander lucioperca]|uniref:perilipin-2 isoform X2 n=1 Tax=Sander lucioperca TaxID=283035 RepID=UPI00125DAAED|nr:perilipin-2 isoform X2 [Sander lucioperca]